MAGSILIVEDSRTQALRLQLELTQYGLQIAIATTGKSGLAAARANPHDAIVLDVDLPEIDGHTLCGLLKTDPTTAHVPVIMLTHRDSARDTLIALDAGADDYIPKDLFAEKNLVTTLRSLGVLEAVDAPRS
jgi:DNA-binding response OmpR family regulator